MSQEFRGDQYGEYPRRAWQGYGDDEAPNADMEALAVVALASGIAAGVGLLVTGLGRLGEPKREKELRRLIESAGGKRLDQVLGKGTSRRVAHGLYSGSQTASHLGRQLGKRAGDLGTQVGDTLSGLELPSGKELDGFLDDLKKNAAEAIASIGKAGQRVAGAVDDFNLEGQMKKGQRAIRDARSNISDLLDQLDSSDLSKDAQKRAKTIRKRAEGLLSDLGADDRRKDAAKKLAQLRKDLAQGVDHLELDSKAKGLADSLGNLDLNLDLGAARKNAGKLLKQSGKELEQASKAAGRAIKKGTADLDLADARKNAGKLLKKGGEQLADAGDTAGGFFANVGDALGNIMDNLREDTLPEVVKAAGRAGEMIQGRVILPAGDLYDENAPKARKLLSEAASNVGDLYDENAPKARKAISELASNVGDLYDENAPKARKAVSEAASNIGDFFQETFAPTVGDALNTVGGKVGDLFDNRDSALETVGKSVGGAAGNVGEIIGSAAGNVGGAVGGAASATGKAVKKGTTTTASTIFWTVLMALGLVYLFAPEEQQRKELYRNIGKMFGQGKDMVQEFRGYDSEVER